METTTTPASRPSARWIVVGTDFSEGSRRALSLALTLAAETGANVACVHAYEDALGTPAFHDPAPELRRQIENAISLCRKCAQQVHVQPYVRRGAPWDKLLNVAAEVGAELIVVGAEGQRSARHAGFLGTVAHRLATASSRAVLVVPSRAPLHEPARD